MTLYRFESSDTDVNLRNLALIQMRKPVALNCGVAAYLFSQLLDLKLTSRIGMTKHE